MKRILIMLTIAAGLSACAAGPIQSTGPRPATNSEPRPATGGEGAVVPEAPSPVAGATGALLERSQLERDAGDLGGAAATIERALSISPDDALLWVELGEIRMAQGNGQLAEEMAQKALTLTGTNSAIAARARRLIRN